MATKEAQKFTLTNVTAGKSWDYNTEPQLKTAARLYAIQHPKDSIAVTINGQTFKLR